MTPRLLSYCARQPAEGSRGLVSRELLHEIVSFLSFSCCRALARHLRVLQNGYHRLLGGGVLYPSLHCSLHCRRAFLVGSGFGRIGSGWVGSGRGGSGRVESVVAIAFVHLGRAKAKANRNVLLP